MLELIDKINFDELYVLLLNATRKTFRDVQEAHPDETFYTFGLHYDNHDCSILPSSNSEEGHLHQHDLVSPPLTEADRDHQTLRWFYTRWSFVDWAYYGCEYACFAPVSTWIGDNLSPFMGLVSDEGEAAYITALNALEMACAKVFQTLDQEGLFGQAEARERVLLNVINNETMFIEDDMSYAYLLNPRSTYERWRFEFEMYQHAIRVFID